MPRILVVDDDRETCRFMDELLRGDDRHIELAHTLRSVELLVPYAEGGSLAELHDIAGEVSREDTADGVRVRALVPARLADRFSRFAAPPSLLAE